jgi:thymidylate kinase
MRAAHWLAGGLNKRYVHAPRPWGRRAPGGGCVIAMVGVDGSGKTTVTAAVRSWLGGEIDVMPIYFGTGDGRPSLLLLPLKLAVPLFTRLFARKPRGSSHGAVSGQAPGRLYAALLAVWSTVLALEKRSKLHAAHRGSARGLVVVADRYPQDENAGYNDGPLLPRLARVPQWLRRFEAGAYALARTLPPDLVIKLDAPAELLAQREPDMDRGVVRERAEALRRLSFPGARVVRVDAAQPLADVIRAVKGAIWSVL